MSARGRVALSLLLALGIAGGPATARADDGLGLADVVSGVQKTVEKTTDQVTGAQSDSGSTSSETSTSSDLGGTVQQAVDDTVEAVSETAATVTATVAETTEAAVETVSDTATPVVERVTETVEPVVSTVADVVQPVVQTVDKTIVPVVESVAGPTASSEPAQPTPVGSSTPPGEPVAAQAPPSITPPQPAATVAEPGWTSPAAQPAPRSSLPVVETPIAGVAGTHTLAQSPEHVAHGLSIGQVSGLGSPVGSLSIGADRLIGALSGAESTSQAPRPAPVPGHPETPRLLPVGTAVAAGIVAATIFLFLAIAGPGRRLRPGKSPPWSPPLLSALERPG